MGKTRRALRKSGYQLEPLEVVSLRVPPEIIERCDWAAAEKGVCRTEFMRSALVNATRDAKPPKNVEIRGFQVERAEWNEWQRIAQGWGHTVESLARHVFGNLGEQLAAKKVKEAAAK